jgi:type VI protein secretion system component VasF
MAVRNLESEDFDRMKNKPSPWMIAAGAFAFLAMAAYLFFAMTLADHMQPAPVPQETVPTTSPPM